MTSPPLQLTKLKTKNMSPKQREYHQFAEINYILSAYNCETSWCHIDDNGPDFIIKFMNTNKLELIPVQLKSRPVLSNKYKNKNLHIAFPYKDQWCIINYQLFEQLILSFNLITKKQLKQKDHYAVPIKQLSHRQLNQIKANTLIPIE